MTHVKDYTTGNGVFTHIYKVSGNEKPVIFIGKYEGAVTGGVDRVRNVRDVVEACAELCEHGDIVMEGLIMSGLQQLTKDVADACAAHSVFHALTLDTPKEKCIEQTMKRRALAGNDKPFDPSKSLLPKHRAVELAAIKLKQWGLDSRVMSQREAYQESCKLLGLTPDNAL
jgi:hypothetical protein